MARGKSRTQYKKKRIRTKRQRGAGGCWGGICSTNKPTVNETAHSSLPPSFKDAEVQMVKNPMFKDAYTPRTPEGAPPENAPTPIPALTWLWTTAEYRFKTKYPKKYHDFRFTQGQAIDYVHGNRDILRKLTYDTVIFVLKSVFIDRKEVHEFLEKASSDIDSLSQEELDYLNNLIIREYNKAEIKILKETVLEDFKGLCYTYTASILEPGNKPYVEELTNLFERLVVSPARALLTRLEIHLQPAGTNVADLVENKLMRIRGTVKQSVNLSSVRGGQRIRKKNLRKTRKNKQRGAGGCFGWGCSSAANTGVNESAIVANPVASADPNNTLIQELENVSLQQVEIQSLEIEQMNLESKQSDVSINVQEQERLNALQSTAAARKNQLSELNARFNKLNAQVTRLTAILTAGIN